MLYRFECKMDEKDYYEFSKYHLKAAKELKKSRSVSKIIVIVMFSLALIYFILRGASLPIIYFAAVVFAVAAVGLILAENPLQLLFIKINIRQMRKKGKLPYPSVSEMEFYDDYFVSEEKVAKTEMKYDALYKVEVNEGKAVYIFLSTVQAYVIPFNAFGSERERVEFIEFIKNKIKK